MKMFSVALVSSALTLIASSSSAASVDWQLDAVHSSISFTVKHLGLSKVRGEFKEFSVAAKGDDKSGKLETLTGTVKVSSIDTQNKDRDGHLQSDDFFNAEKFPELKLALKKITWKGNEFVADAEVTMRDVTKPVQFKGEVSTPRLVDFGQGATLRTGYTANGKVSRKDFGLKWNKIIEGTSVVSDEVQIELNVELFSEPAKKAEPKK